MKILPFLCCLFLLLGNKQNIFAQVDSSVQNEIKNPEKILLKPVVPTKKNLYKKDSLRTTLLPKKNIIDSATTSIDTLQAIDSMLLAKQLDSLKTDSLLKQNNVVKTPVKDTTTYSGIIADTYFPVFLTPSFKVDVEKKQNSKDELFYVLISIISIVAFVKVVFPKYFNNLFSMFFQTSFRQKQTRDQLIQNKIASLLLNLVFVGSFGIYLAIIATNKSWVRIDFWWLVGCTVSILVVIYLFKFLFLHFFGWMFNSKEAANTYIFIVFLCNKIIAILLIPFLLLISFSSGTFVEIAFIISLFLLGGGLLYRYLVTLGIIRTDLNVNALHFFLYLCSFELLPLVLIYKAVFNFIGATI